MAPNAYWKHRLAAYVNANAPAKDSNNTTRHDQPIVDNDMLAAKKTKTPAMGLHDTTHHGQPIVMDDTPADDEWSEVLGAAEPMDSTSDNPFIRQLLETATVRIPDVSVLGAAAILSGQCPPSSLLDCIVGQLQDLHSTFARRTELMKSVYMWRTGKTLDLESPMPVRVLRKNAYNGEIDPALLSVVNVLRNIDVLGDPMDPVPNQQLDADSMILDKTDDDDDRTISVCSSTEESMDEAEDGEVPTTAKAPEPVAPTIKHPRAQKPRKRPGCKPRSPQR